jgi:hypothetical protein
VSLVEGFAAWAGAGAALGEAGAGVVDTVPPWATLAWLAVVTAWWALAMAEVSAGALGELLELEPPPVTVFLRTAVHSANTATVATSRAMRGFGRLAITPVFGIRAQNLSHALSGWTMV